MRWVASTGFAPGILGWGVTLGIALGVTGCGADAAGDSAACDGNGDLHGDHCHCDPGFVPTEDALGCVPAADAGADAGLLPDGHDGGGADASPPPDDGALAFAPTTTRAFTDRDNEDARVWVLEAADSTVVLRVELYESFGAPTAPGAVSLDITQASYATCGTCVVLQTGCEAHDDHFHCQTTFMPQVGGQLELDALDDEAGGRLAGRLTDVVFQEVRIANDLVTTPVTGGQVFRLDRFAFDAVLEAPPAQDAECGGHGHMHGDHCHCDPGYQPQPDNPANCIPA